MYWKIISKAMPCYVHIAYVLIWISYEIGMRLIVIVCYKGYKEGSVVYQYLYLYTKNVSCIIQDSCNTLKTMRMIFALFNNRAT